MADQGLTNKDKVCQFFASNAGLHFRSADVAAALGLDGRSVGQQLARLWRAGFVEKVQTTPYATWRMKLQTYPGRNLHGPAAPKPASPTPHTPAKKSTRGFRTLEEVRNDSGHCAMGSPLVQEWREGETEEGDEESVDQESSSVEARSVRLPPSNSVSSKPPSVTTKRTMSSLDNVSAQRNPEEAPTKRKLGRPPGSKNKSSTTLLSRQEGTTTRKASSTSASCQRTTVTATAVKRKLGAESNNTDQLLKKKVKKTMSQTTVQGCRDRSSTDDESSSQKLVGTEVKRKVRADSKNADKGLKGKLKKTMSQFTDREDCSSRSDTDFELSYQVPNKTRLMPTTVSSQRASATAVKKNPNKSGLKVKKTMSQTTVKEGKSSTSGADSLQNKTRIMPATLAPSLNKPAGNMETKLINFIQEAQGMLVMTGDDVAKALGSKPKETHRLLLHMQRTGQVRKLCDKPTRWMMLGGGQGRVAWKGQVQLRTTAPSVTVTKQQVASTQASRNLHTSTASSTQTSRNLHVDMATEGESSRTGHIVSAWSGCDVDDKKPALPISSCEKEEDIASTFAKESTKFGRCLSTAEEDVDVRSISEDQDSDFLDEEGFCTNGNKSSPVLSLPSKKQSVTGNQKSQVTTTLRRSLSPCGRYVRRTPVKKLVLSHKQNKPNMSVGMSTKDCFNSNIVAAKKKSLEGSAQNQMRNQNAVSSTSSQVKKGLSNFRIPKKNQLSSRNLGKSKLTVSKKSGHFCEGKEMSLSVSPSESEVERLDSKKDSTVKTKQDSKSKTQRTFSSAKTPPHILKHSVSYFASTSEEPNKRSKLPNASKTTRDDRKVQDRAERSFVRPTDNGVLQEPLADIDVMVDLSVDKSPHLKSRLHSCGLCDSERANQQSPLFIKTPPSHPPILHPHDPAPTGPPKKHFLVGTFESHDSPPILARQEETRRSYGTESPALRTARRNLNPQLSSEASMQHQQRRTSRSLIPEQSMSKENVHRGFRSGLVEKNSSENFTGSHSYVPYSGSDRMQQQFKMWSDQQWSDEVKTAASSDGQEYVSGQSLLDGSAKESFSSFQDIGTDPRRAIGRGVYAELQDNNKAARGVFGQRECSVNHFEVLGQCDRRMDTTVAPGHHALTQQQQYGRVHGCNTATNSKVASTHCKGAVPGAEQLVSHPHGCTRTDTAWNIYQKDDKEKTTHGKLGHGQRYAGNQSKVTATDEQCENKHSKTTATDENVHLCHNSQFDGLSMHRKRDNVGRLLAQAIKSAVSPLNVAGGKKMTFNTRDVNRTEDSSKVVGQTGVQCGTSQHVKSDSILEHGSGSTHQSWKNATNQEQTRNSGPANLCSFEPGKGVSKIGMGSCIPSGQHRLMNDRPHHVGTVSGAELLVGHPRGCSRTDPAWSVCPVDKVENAEQRTNLGRKTKSEDLYQSAETKSAVETARLYKVNDDVSLRGSERMSASGAQGVVHSLTMERNTHIGLDTSQATESCTDTVPVLGADQHVFYQDVKQAPINPEGLRISEKSKRNESARWQRPRSPKSFLIDYWKVKEESKDTTKVAPKDVAKVESKNTIAPSSFMKNKLVEDTTVLNDSYSRLLTCGTIKAEINDSEEETSSNQMKNCSRSRINVMEVLPGDSTNLTDEMSLNVLKEEPETLYSFETQTRFVHTSQVRTNKCEDFRQYVHNSPVQVSSDDEDVVFSLEGRAVPSLTGPVEQSSWTQPKALYASDKRETQKQEESEFQGSCGQGEAPMNEAWTQPKALYTSDMREPQEEEEEEGQGSSGHEEATVDEAGCCDGLKVSQVSRNQGSVARVTPQGSRQVVTSAHPSSTLLQQGHPIVQLNELCQRNRLRICFQDISVTGPAHRPRVQLAAVVGDRTFQAQASSKKAARRKAAQDALQALYQEGYK